MSNGGAFFSHLKTPLAVVPTPRINQDHDEDARANGGTEGQHVQLS